MRILFFKLRKVKFLYAIAYLSAVGDTGWLLYARIRHDVAWIGITGCPLHGIHSRVVLKRKYKSRFTINYFQFSFYLFTFTQSRLIISSECLFGCFYVSPIMLHFYVYPISRLVNKGTQNQCSCLYGLNL